LKSSGLVVDSVGTKKNHQDNSNSKKSGFQKFNSPMASSPSGVHSMFKKDPSISPPATKEDRKETESIVEEEVPPAVEDEEEYNDDDFEADSQKSATLKTK